MPGDDRREGRIRRYGARQGRKQLATAETALETPEARKGLQQSGRAAGNSGDEVASAYLERPSILIPQHDVGIGV
jgi:hypothetical protein